jgi:hypothetical protein
MFLDISMTLTTSSARRGISVFGVHNYVNTVTLQLPGGGRTQADCSGSEIDLRNHRQFEQSAAAPQFEA